MRDEFPGFQARLYPQLFRQDGATRFILGDGRAAFPVQRQRLDQLLVRFFPPRLQRELLPRQGLGSLIICLGQPLCRQLEQGIQRQPMVSLSFLAQPVVKGRAVAGEAGQKVATVKGNGRLPITTRHSRQKVGHIQAIIAGGIKLRGGTGNEEKVVIVRLP